MYRPSLPDEVVVEEALSTPSLGITAPQKTPFNRIGLAIFQLPLSGSRQGGADRTREEPAYPFNSLSRDHRSGAF